MKTCAQDKEEVRVHTPQRQVKTLPLKSAVSLDVPVIDDLEYVHSYDYINTDVKASVLLLGFGKGSKNKVHLVDFALACWCTQNGRHKEYKEDRRNAHYGTIEFTSRDAHIGAHSRRGDVEIPEYNLLQWFCCRLPWKNNLTDPEYISQLESSLMENIHLVTSKGFPRGEIPCGIIEFLQYVAPMKFEHTPKYKRLNRILEKGIQAVGSNADGRLPFTPRHNSFWPKNPVLQEILTENSTSESGDENAVRKPPPANVHSGHTPPANGHTPLVRKKNLRSPATAKLALGLGGLVELGPQGKPVKKNAVSAISARSSQYSSKNSSCEGSNSVGLDNPTSQTLEVLPRKDALSAQQQEGVLRSGGNGRKCSSNSPPCEPPPVTSVGRWFALSCADLQPHCASRQ